MKIVQLTSVHYVFDTRIFHKISKSLVKAGYSVDLIAQHQKNEIVDGVKIVALPTAKKKSDRPFKIIPSLFKKAIQYPPSTIFHFHDPELIPIGLLLKWFGYKVIYDVHEDVPKDLLTKDWVPIRFRNLISNIFRRFEKLTSSKFDAVITVVPFITNRLFDGKAVEIRNYPILKDQKYSKSAQKHNAVYIGNLTERRGLMKILEALRYTKEEIPLLIGGTFGSKSFEKKFTKEASDIDVSHYGWVNEKQITDLLKSSKVGLLTLGDIPSHRISFPVKLFEYMMHELPVIASNFKLWEEIITEANCGLLVNPNSPKEIAEALDWIIDHPNEAKKMGQNGRKAVLEKYNWANEEKKLLKLYSELENKNNLKMD